MTAVASNVRRLPDRFAVAVDELVATFGIEAALAALHASRKNAMRQIAEDNLNDEETASAAAHAVLCARETARLTP